MARARLKKKIYLNYRRATGAEIRDHRCCWFCKQLKAVQVTGIRGANLRRSWRCDVMGQGASVRYDIDINAICEELEARPTSQVTPEGYECQP